MRKSRVVMCVVAAGAAGALAVGIPAWADGDAGASTAAGSASAAGCNPAHLRHTLRQAAAADPALKAEVGALKSLPRSERAAALRDYVSSHPTAKAELHGLAKHARACGASA